MEINANFGIGYIAIVDRKWITAPVDLEDCISSRIKNGCWGYCMSAEMSLISLKMLNMTVHIGGMTIFVWRSSRVGYKRCFKVRKEQIERIRLGKIS